MANSQTGVYIKDKVYGWLQANILSSNEDDAPSTQRVSVQLPTDVYGSNYTNEERLVKLKDYDDGALPLQNIDEAGHPIIVADMCDLPSLHEAAILYNLKYQHEASIPYTRVGDIVIAMNPFQWIKELYSQEQMNTYVDKLIKDVDVSGDSKSGLDPHVYEVSALAYRGLAIDNCCQSILVSGESGAGKTETVKIVMSHLASINTEDCIPDADASMSTTPTKNTGNCNKVVKKVLDSNPLLEAFGNAKTVRNDNSSRFGKYIHLQFDTEDAETAAYSGKTIPSCLLAGSNCETYLLEKSRVVGHDDTERTYHIFYQLLGAPDDVKSEIWKGLEGTDNKSFKYVGETDTTVIEHRSDGERWHSTVDALALVGIEGDKLTHLMRAICTVMQLGNLTFDVDPSNEDGSVVTSLDELKKLSDIMGVATEDLQKAFTFRTIFAAKESYDVPIKPVTAKDGCDAFAKEIYQRVFDWIVKEINQATCAEINYGDDSDVDQYGTIGLLDIFGFESFKVNRFEQFCINYANETLQQKYNLDIFKSVQDEYEYEGIEMSNVTFVDNSNVVDLIQGKMGLIAVLNEECVRPHGNDSAFVSKAKTLHKEVDCLVQNPLHCPTEFAISHYATTVTYDASHFVQKNTDTLPRDLIQCANLSSNMLISREIQAAADANTASSNTRGRTSTLTVGTKFRSQLSQLMQNIGKTRSRYIRCIKPNPEKVPLKTNLSHSVEQLRCAGVVAAVTISRVAYPNRLLHDTVLDRFYCLSEEKIDTDEIEDIEAAVKLLMAELLSGSMETDENGDLKNVFAIGKSRVYFKAGALELLESQRMAKLRVYATAIQQIARGFIAKSRFLSLKAACIEMQAIGRRNIARSNLVRSCTAITNISCWIRCTFARRKLLALRKEKACTLIQTICRIFQAKTMFLNSRQGAIEMQRIWRGALQRPRYVVMKKEAEEEARQNVKLAALQKRLADAEMKYLMSEKKRAEAERNGGSGGTIVVTEDEKKEDEATTTLLDESTQMLETLRKQLFELKGKNFLLRNDLAEMKNSYHHVSEQLASVNASYVALKQNAAFQTKSSMKINVQAAKDKKELSSVKRELRQSEEAHSEEVRKLRDLMKARQADHEQELSRLQDELQQMHAQQEQDRNNQRRNKAPSPKNVQQNNKNSNKKKSNQSKSRATFGQKGQQKGNLFTPPETVDSMDSWGHDSYVKEHGSVSTSGSSVSKPRRRNNRRNASNKRPNKINTEPQSGGTSLARRVVTPEQTKRGKGKSQTKESQDSSRSLNSKSKSAPKKNEMKVVKGSSLATAAKKSSLAKAAVK